eukprot:6798410-Prymnesium_polylepis.2
MLFVGDRERTMLPDCLSPSSASCPDPGAFELLVNEHKVGVVALKRRPRVAPPMAAAVADVLVGEDVPVAMRGVHLRRGAYPAPSVDPHNGEIPSIVMRDHLSHNGASNDAIGRDPCMCNERPGAQPSCNVVRVVLVEHSLL